MPSLAQEAPRLYKSGHLLGRGHSGMSQTDTEDAIYYNPSGLVANRKASEGAHVQKSKPPPFGFVRAVYLAPFLEASKNVPKLRGVTGKSTADQVDLFKDLIGQNLHVGAQDIAAVILNNMAASILVGAQGGALVYQDPNNAGIVTVDMELLVSTVGTLSYAHSVLGDWLTLGTTVKYIKQQRRQLLAAISDINRIKNFNFAHSNAASGMGLDLGLQSNFPVFLKPKVALLVENLGDTRMRGKISDPTEPPVANILQTINLGISAELEKFWGKLEASFDFRDLLGRVEPNPGKRTHLGLEYSFHNWVGITTGLNQGYKTIGLFFNCRYARLDLGSYVEEVGSKPGLNPDPRYFVQATGSF